MMLWLHFVGCSSPRPQTPPIPVRTGWIGSTGEQALADGRFFGVQGGERPVIADCVTIGSVELGDVRREVAAGIPAPDTALAFSPDGSRLAIGSYLGELIVLDGWTGAVLARRTLAQSAVKRVAWSPDGRVLYAAEQSVDGFLRALDPSTLADRATFRLADALESSAPPAPDDLYGLYTLPGPYALTVLPEGDILLVGAHGWTPASGRKNRSQVWRLRLRDQGFEVIAAWPDAPADATFLAASVTQDRVGIAVSRSAQGPVPQGLGVGGVAVLDTDLHLVTTAVPPPLKPWFDKAFVWESIGLHGDRLTLGLGDGRVWRGDRSRGLGTPILSGEVPIAATIGTLFDRGDTLYTLTSGTSIPYGSGRAEAQPPELHPAENTVFALEAETLETLWSWRGREQLQGMSQRGRWLVVGVSSRDPEQPGRHGVVVFDLERSGTGAERLAASCSTGQPVFFRTAIAPDGRLAVASFPEKLGDDVRGSYRVQIFL